VGVGIVAFLTAGGRIVVRSAISTAS